MVLRSVLALSNDSEVAIMIVALSTLLKSRKRLESVRSCHWQPPCTEEDHAA